MSYRSGNYSRGTPKIVKILVHEDFTFDIIFVPTLKHLRWATRIHLTNYSFISLFTSNRNKKSLILILLSISAFGLVVLQEYTEHTLDWPYLHL